MAITVACDHCGARLKLKDDSNVGKRVPCPKCKQPFVIQPIDDEEEFEVVEGADEYGDAEEEYVPPPKPRAGNKGKKGKGRKGRRSSDGPPMGLIIGGVAALLVLIGVGLWLGGVFGGSNDSPAPVAEAPAAAPAKQPEKPAEKAAAPPVEPIDFAYLPDDTDMLVHVRLGELLKAPLFVSLTKEDENKAQLEKFREQFGIGVDQVISLTVASPGTLAELARMSTESGGAGLLNYGGQGLDSSKNVLTVIRTKGAFDASKLDVVNAEEPAGQAASAAVYRFKQSPDPNLELAVCSIEPKVLLVGTLETVQAAASRAKGSGAESRLGFAKTQVGQIVFAAAIEEAVKELKDGGASQKQFASAIDLYDKGGRGLLLAVNVTDGVSLRAGVDTAGGDAAPVLKDLQSLVESGKQSLDQMREQAPPALMKPIDAIFKTVKASSQQSLAMIEAEVSKSAIDQLTQGVTESLPMMMAMAPDGMNINPMMLASGKGGVGSGAAGIPPEFRNSKYPISRLGGTPGLPRFPVKAATPKKPGQQGTLLSGSSGPAPGASGPPGSLGGAYGEGERTAVDSGESEAEMRLREMQEQMTAADYPADFEGFGSPGANQQRGQKQIGAYHVKDAAPVTSVEGLPEGVVAMVAAAPENQGLQPQAAASSMSEDYVDYATFTGEGGPAPGGAKGTANTLAFDLVMFPTGQPQVVGYAARQFNSVTDSTGKPLRRAVGPRDLRAEPDTFYPVQRVYVGEEESPAVAVPASFAAATELKQLAGGEGTVQLQVANTIQDVVIPDANAVIGQLGPDAEPGSLGVRIERGTGGELLVYCSRADAVLTDVQATDAEGKLLKGVSVKPELRGSAVTHVIAPAGKDPLPIPLMLRLRVASELSEVPLKFAFGPLALPDGTSVPATTETAGVASDRPAPDLAGTEITAQIRWGAGDERNPPTLEAVIEFVGPPFIHTLATGRYKEDARIGAGKLFLNRKAPMYQKRPTGFDAYDPKSGPTGGGQIVLSYVQPRQLPETITSLSGSARVKTASGTKVVTVDGLQEKLGQTFTSPELEQAGLAIKADLEGEIVTFSITGDDSLVHSIDLIAPAGGIIPPAEMTRTVEHRIPMWHLTLLRPQLLEGAGVRIVLYEDVKEVEVPFLFKELKIPPAANQQNQYGPPGSQPGEYAPEGN